MVLEAATDLTAHGGELNARGMMSRTRRDLVGSKIESRVPNDNFVSNGPVPLNRDYVADVFKTGSDTMSSREI